MEAKYRRYYIRLALALKDKHPLTDSDDKLPASRKVKLEYFLVIIKYLLHVTDGNHTFPPPLTSATPSFTYISPWKIRRQYVTYREFCSMRLDLWELPPSVKAVSKNNSRRLTKVSLEAPVHS